MSTSTENQLISVVMQLGAIAECNCHYTAGLAKRIEETGKAVEALTIAELITLADDYNKLLNTVHGVAV